MTSAPARDQGVEIKSLAAIPFGITTTALAIAVAVSLATKADFNLIGISFFLVIPIGAVLVGALAASGLAGGLWLMQIRPTGTANVASLLLGLACFFGVYYGIYDRTYVDDEYTINYDGEGDRIGSLVNLETGEAFTFWDYVDLDVSNREISMFRGGAPSSSIDMSGSVGGAFSWVLFGLEAIGLVGGAFGAVQLLSKLDYCASCRRYMKGAGTVSIVPQALPDVWARLRTATAGQDGLDAAAIDAERPGNKEPSIRIDVSRCDGCQAGIFTARSFTRQGADGEYKEVPTARITMGIASPLSGYAPASSPDDVFGRQPSIYDRDYDPRQPAL